MLINKRINCLDSIVWFTFKEILLGKIWQFQWRQTQFYGLVTQHHDKMISFWVSYISSTATNLVCFVEKLVHFVIKSQTSETNRRTIKTRRITNNYWDLRVPIACCVPSTLYVWYKNKHIWWREHKRTNEAAAQCLQRLKQRCSMFCSCE